MILSPDSLLTDNLGNYTWSKENLRKAWNHVWIEFSYVLTKRFRKLVLMIGLPASGKTTWLETNRENDVLYVDATFIDPTWRSPFIQKAQERGIPVEAIVLDTPLDIILQRNRERPVGRSPEESSLLDWYKKLNTDPPTLNEGFSKVSLIQYNKNS